jgi:diaminopimelate epimerase
LRKIYNMKFYKYQGTGNDFVMIDNRSSWFDKTDSKLISSLCDRRFGIGADGLILLENDAETDFRMVYFNADGKQSSMCGNGGRCLVAFAKQLKIIENQATFMAIDGLHYAEIDSDNKVSLQMCDVDALKIHDAYLFLNTGSPHHIVEVANLAKVNVKEEGAKIRYSGLYGVAGSNVNFVTQESENQFKIRTYERGVEDETLSCGTGATAVAIGMHAVGKTKSNQIKINVAGGALEISFDEKNKIYTHVFLKGAAELVFEGTINIG